MNPPPEFSVVIPTYNRLEFLKEALASVAAQTFTDYEIIVVDDGSNDGTTDYLASLVGRVTVLRQENRGPSAARNLGARHSSGRYIAFLDSDDLWLPWTLATYNALIAEHMPSTLCAAVLEFEGAAPPLKHAPLHAERFRDFMESARSPRNAGSGMLVIRKSVFVGVGGFDEGLTVAEDQDLFFRLGTEPDFIRVESPVTLACRRHGGNTARLLTAACYGADVILSHELKCRYPGGTKRARERKTLIGRMLRPVAFSATKAGLGRQAWRLYRRSFAMNVMLGRWAFLLGFPLYAAWIAMRRFRTSL